VVCKECVGEWCMNGVSCVELGAMLQRGEVVVVDVREPVEHNFERIKGSILMPSSSFDKAKLLNEGVFAGKKIVFHCKGGTRSGMVINKLIGEGVDCSGFYNLNGGITAWINAGLEVERPACARRSVSVEGQVRILVGSLVALFSLLGYFVDASFVLAALFMGCGFAVSGVTGFCGAALLLAKAPWNRSKGSVNGVGCSISG
jgi:rhodanese-related sulfurtransferase